MEASGFVEASMDRFLRAAPVIAITALGLTVFHAAFAAASSKAAASKADSLLAAAKQAMGGAAWDKVVTWHETGKIAGGGLSGTYESWADLPSLRNSNTYVLGPSSGGSGWDGKRAWTMDSTKEVRVETSGEAVAQALQDAYRGQYGFFFPDRFKSQREYAGQKSADGKTYDVLQLTPQGAEPFELWLDPENHRVEREVQLTGGQPQTFILSDFASFDGLLVPQKTIDRVGNNPKFDTITEVRKIALSGPEQLARYAPPPPPVNTAQWPAGKDSVTVPFRLLNNHIYLDASINGSAPRQFVFDTGATDILLPSAAKALNIAVEGALPGGGFGDQIQSFGFAKVKSVSLGGLTLPDQVFGTAGFGNWVQVEGADSSGLLGYEFVKRAVLSIDYAHRTMTFKQQEAFHPPQGAAALPFTFDGHIPMVKGSLDGIPGEFELDTGSRGALTVMMPFAKAHDLIDKYHATRTVTAGYGAGGPSKVLLARAARLTLGSVSIDAPVTEFVTDAKGSGQAARTAGNIGGDLLKRFTVTLDYAHRTLWLQPNDLSRQREVFDRSGLWIARAKDGGIAVMDVANLSAAAQSGLTIGDVIESVNGKAAKDVALYDLREELKGAVGTAFKLQVKGKAGERGVTLTLADQV
jgi:aspartyl protease/PDZ domain-containing protein